MILIRRCVALLALLSAVALGQEIRIDGSSTVYPITLAVAEEFSIEYPDANVSVAFSGTGGGFKKFCVGEAQVTNASRIVKTSEWEFCETNGVEFIEIPVAFDALTVAVNKENDWATCMSVEELNMIWRPGSTVNTWSEIRPEWPNQEIVLYAPGVDSGTFDYFTDEINGESGAVRTDCFASEDDNVLVQGIEQDVNALGFFGYAYYLEEADKLNAVHIDGGEGCVEPSTTTIEGGIYTPLARPLFIYVSKNATESHPYLQTFVEFYLSYEAREFIADTGYALLDEEAYELSLQRFNSSSTGSIFIDGAGKTVLEVLGAE